MTHDPREALKPCPFCGGEAKIFSYRTSEDSEGVHIECIKCGVRTDATDDAYADRLTAVSMWNTRALTTSPGEQEQPQAAGWNEAIEVCIRELQYCRDHGHEPDITTIKKLKALLREAPAPEGVVGKWAVCERCGGSCGCRVPAPSRPDAGGGVRVKPLEWHDNRHAQSILGVYSINSWSSGAFSILRPNKGYPDNNSFPTVDEAKAAAQADYESRIFSALSNPSAAAESNASVEARLREDKLAAERQYLEEIADGAWGDNPLTQSAAKERLAALSAVGDEAKKSEGGVDWDDVRGIAPNATGDLSSEAFIREQRDSWDDHPSSPTAERREIVARIIDPEVFAKYDAELAKNRRAENGKRWADVCYGEAICRALAKADAILAALDGGASA